MGSSVTEQQLRANAPENAPAVQDRKVLIIVENLPVPFDRRVWRECLALREAGYKVSVISPKGMGATKSREVLDEISIYRYPLYQSTGGFVSYLCEYSVALLMSFVLMWVVLLREGYDVIQICNPPDLLILVAFPFKLLGKTIIFDQHDISPEIYQAQKGREGQTDLVVRALLFFERLTYRFSDLVLVVNESCRRIALSRGLKKERDVFVVRNGPSLKNIRSAEADPVLKNGSRYLLSYVGMMGPQEGIDILLQVIHNLVAVHGRRDFHVRIMGDGTVLQEMRMRAVELDLKDAVTFTGHVDYVQVMEGIATADLCLCPDPKTPLSDKCSLVKTVEYMSLGRAFVAFDLEEVRHSAGEAALYAKPNDAADFAEKVNYLLNHDELRARMGKFGRERVLERLVWEHSKEALYAAYDQAFAGQAGVVGVRQ